MFYNNKNRMSLLVTDVQSALNPRRRSSLFPGPVSPPSYARRWDGDGYGGDDGDDDIMSPPTPGGVQNLKILNFRT